MKKLSPILLSLLTTVLVTGQQIQPASASASLSVASKLAASASSATNAENHSDAHKQNVKSPTTPGTNQLSAKTNQGKNDQGKQDQAKLDQVQAELGSDFTDVTLARYEGQVRFLPGNGLAKFVPVDYKISDTNPNFNERVTLRDPSYVGPLRFFAKDNQNDPNAKLFVPLAQLQAESEANRQRALAVNRPTNEELALIDDAKKAALALKAQEQENSAQTAAALEAAGKVSPELTRDSRVTLEPVGETLLVSAEAAEKSSATPAKATKQGAEKPADKPAEKPTEKPAHEPESQPAPADKPETQPAPADKPETQPSTHPADPADKPEKKPADKPDQPGDVPTEPKDQPGSDPAKPSNQPTSDPTKPVDQPGDKPADKPEHQPRPTPVPADKPAPAPGPAPADKPEDQPQPVPTDKPAPADKPEDQPAPAPADKPKDQPAPAPADKPENQPAPAPADKPEDQPAPAPADKPEDQPAPQSAQARLLAAGYSLQLASLSNAETPATAEGPLLHPLQVPQQPKQEPQPEQEPKPEQQPAQPTQPAVQPAPAVPVNPEPAKPAQPVVPAQPAPATPVQPTPAVPESPTAPATPTQPGAKPAEAPAAQPVEKPAEQPNNQASDTRELDDPADLADDEYVLQQPVENADLNRVSLPSPWEVNKLHTNAEDGVRIPHNQDQNFRPNPTTNKHKVFVIGIYQPVPNISDTIAYSAQEKFGYRSLDTGWALFLDEFHNPGQTLAHYRSVVQNLNDVTLAELGNVAAQASLFKSVKNLPDAYLYRTYEAQVNKFRSVGVPVSPANLVGWWPNPRPSLNNLTKFNPELYGVWIANNIDENNINPLAPLYLGYPGSKQKFTRDYEPNTGVAYFYIREQKDQDQEVRLQYLREQKAKAAKEKALAQAKAAAKAADEAKIKKAQEAARQAAQAEKDQAKKDNTKKDQTPDKPATKPAQKSEK